MLHLAGVVCIAHDIVDGGVKKGCHAFQGIDIGGGYVMLVLVNRLLANVQDVGQFLLA